MVGLVPISGNGARPSVFGWSVQGNYGFHPTLAGNTWLGQTPADWYRRAKQALAKFDELLARTAKIANKTQRETILAWVGNAQVEDTPAYRYATVKSDLQYDVEAYTPPNVNAYQVPRRTSRIEKLEEFNKEFEAKVSEAEKVYGKLPEPAVIEKEKIVRMETPVTEIPWGTIALVGAGAVVVALGATLLFGGK
jgi:hypothetical protein